MMKDDGDGKRKLAELAAKYMLRTERGSGLIGHMTDMFRDVLQGTVYLFAIQGFFHITLSPWLLPLIVVIKKVCDYLLGWIDEHIGFWKIENGYRAKELNPFFEKMDAKIESIQKDIRLLRGSNKK